METGWAALAVPGEKERRHGSVALLTTGRKDTRKVFLAFTEVGRHLFPQLLDLLVESGYRARKPHYPIFWLFLIKAVSINRWWHMCKVLSQYHVALGGSQPWEQGTCCYTQQ